MTDHNISNTKAAINVHASQDTLPLEVSAQDLLQWSRGTWLAVDLRDEASCAYGMMEGAVRISEAELLDFVQKLPASPVEERTRDALISPSVSMKVTAGEAQISPAGSSKTTSDHASLPEAPADREVDREDSGDISKETFHASARLEDALCAGLPIVLYCKYGLISRDAAEAFREKGWKNVCSLAGGYGRWALEESYRAAQDEQRRGDIEKSLRKTFKHDLVGRFEKAVVQYGLVEEGDRIAVCISGGKDSMLMAKLFQELKRHNKFPFSLVFLCMDPGYNRENRGIIENNARLLGIPIEFFETDIFDAVFNIEKSPCYLCARMRRGYLYRFAREHGCNKIALGHHYDDVIETILMGMLYSGQYQAMMPKLRSTNFEGMELIRPMYLVREKDIIRWRDHNGLRFIQCACKFTETCSSCADDGTSNSKRLETKKLIAALKETNPQVESNIFRATENVVLNKVLGYKLHGEKHSFLEDY